jgi:beta-lactamase regulating signal transducer with metallopeptidase domain/protocatechuate 3,4-dioxygenase beta subunit
MLTLNGEFCERLAATLAHSLWQGLLIGIVFTIATMLLRSQGPQVRHAIGLFSLGAFLGWVPMTFLFCDPKPLSTVANRKTQSVERPVVVNSPLTGKIEATERSGNTTMNAMVETVSFPTAIRRDRWQQCAPWLTGLYLIGVVVGLIRLGCGVWSCRGLRRAAEPVSDPEWLRLVDVVRDRIGLRIAPAVFWCRTSLVPTVVGIIRPVILLPIAGVTGLSSEQMEQILRHEMMHIQRGDALVNLIVSVAEQLLFFHPVVWIISRQIRLERELCCDLVSASSTGERWRYAQLLVQLAEQAHRQTTAATQLAVVSDASQLRARIDTLMNRPRQQNSFVDLRSFAVLTIVVFGLFLTASRISLADEPGKVPPPVVGQGLPDWIARQAGVEAREVEEQEEQMELSKNLPLKFAQHSQENELAGVVVDSAGQPIAGALVDFYPAFTGNETRTDDQGIFRYKFEQAGRNETVEVRFSKEGFSPIYRRKQSLGVAEFRVVLNNKTYLEGRILAENGKPVAKTRVVAAHPYIWAGDYPTFDRETVTTTDENGRYRLYLCPEIYTVSVISQGQGVERVSEIEVIKNEGQKLDLQLNSGVHLKAKVLDSETMKPVPGLVLYHRTNPQARGVSNAQGVIEIPNCLPGDEEFQVGSGVPVMTHGYFSSPTEPFGSWWSEEAKKPWHRMKTTEQAIMFGLAAGMEPVTIYVEAGVLVSGKVTDPDGKPVAKATVAPARTGTGNSLTGDTRYSVETKDDGTYKVLLPSSGGGAYNLIAHDGSYSKWRKFAAGVTEPMETDPGQRIENLDIQLHRPAMVRGKVKATDGRKVGGLAVRAHAHDKRGNRYYDPTTKTKDDGTFEVRFIRPGKHYIQVEPFWLTAEQAQPQTTVIVELDEGEMKEGIQLEVADQ